MNPGSTAFFDCSGLPETLGVAMYFGLPATAAKLIETPPNRVAVIRSGEEPEIAFVPLSTHVQVLEILKKEHKFLEVIILTGHGSLDSAVECTRLGAFDYLPKPYELESLLEKLQKAYEARLQKKFESDQERLEKIANLATGHSALGILRELRKLDDEEK